MVGITSANRMKTIQPTTSTQKEEVTPAAYREQIEEARAAARAKFSDSKTEDRYQKIAFGTKSTIAGVQVPGVAILDRANNLIPGATILHRALNEAESIPQQLIQPTKTLSTAEKKLLLDSMMQQIQRNLQVTVIRPKVLHQIALNAIKNLKG
jgi:hypothetical protein